MVQVINIWQERQQPLSEMIAPLRKYSATGEVNFRVADAPAVLERIEAHYVARGATADHLDGLTIDMGDWWFSLRSSNTEPLLRLNLEAVTEAERDSHFVQVRDLIEGK